MSPGRSGQQGEILSREKEAHNLFVFANKDTHTSSPRSDSSAYIDIPDGHNLLARKAMSSVVDPAFVGVGKEAGLTLWRIEKKQVVLQPAVSSNSDLRFRLSCVRCTWKYISKRMGFFDGCHFFFLIFGLVCADSPCYIS